MRASRDYTAGPDTGASVGLLERDYPRTRPPRRSVNAVSEAPSRTIPRTHGRDIIPRAGRLGSQQVVSERGRRLTPIRQVTLFSRLSAIAIVLLIAGVGLAMWLSAVSTTQTFRIQELTVQESQLANEVETLNRDLENVRSAADVSRQAVAERMGVPVQPGVVNVGENGDITEQRPASNETESIIDVNENPVRPGKASSDPDDTEGVSDSLQRVPQGQQREAPGQQGRERGGNGTQPAPAGDQRPPELPARAPYEAQSN